MPRKSPESKSLQQRRHGKQWWGQPMDHDGVTWCQSGLRVLILSKTADKISLLVEMGTRARAEWSLQVGPGHQRTESNQKNAFIHSTNIYSTPTIARSSSSWSWHPSQMTNLYLGQVTSIERPSSPSHLALPYALDPQRGLTLKPSFRKYHLLALDMYFLTPEKV